MTFAQPVFWNVRWLVQSLNRSNYERNVSELDALIHPFKQKPRADVLSFFFRTILEELQPGKKGEKDEVFLRIFLDVLVFVGFVFSKEL